MKARTLAPALALLALTACGGADYGFSRNYHPLSQEEQALREANLPGYEEVHTNPAAFRAQTIAWFGVVSSIEAGPNGQSLLHMTFRTHQDRHLCADETDGSCRVTVSDRSTGPYSVLLTVRPEDASGHDGIAVGSLLRTFGHTTGDIDSDGGPVLAVTYYRHWPRGAWVTTADRVRMRR